MTGVNLLRQTDCRIYICYLLNAILNGWPHYDSINGHRVLLFELMRTAVLEAPPPLMHIGWLIQHQPWNPVQHCTADEGPEVEFVISEFGTPIFCVVMPSNISSLLDHPLCKWISVLQPSRLTHVPPDMVNSKLCKESIFGNSAWHCVYKIYGLFRWRN
jgi:hypothetical protein